MTGFATGRGRVELPVRVEPARSCRGREGLESAHLRRGQAAAEGRLTDPIADAGDGALARCPVPPFKRAPKYHTPVAERQGSAHGRNVAEDLQVVARPHRSGREIPIRRAVQKSRSPEVFYS